MFTCLLTFFMPHNTKRCFFMLKSYVFLHPVGNAIQAFGNGTDVGVWQPMSPVQTTTSTTTPYQRNRERNPNTIDNHINTDPGIYHFCGSLQVRLTQTHAGSNYFWIQSSKVAQILFSVSFTNHIFLNFISSCCLTVGLLQWHTSLSLLAFFHFVFVVHFQADII